MKANHKKTLLQFFASALFATTFVACTMGLGDTRPYFFNRKSTIEQPMDTGEVIVEESLSEGQIDIFNTDDEFNKRDYIFDGSVIDSFIFKASFDDASVPIYDFVKNPNGWKLEDEKYRKYHYDGTNDGNKAQGFAINPAHFYRYNGYNPLTKIVGGRMERFRFFAILNSKAGGGVAQMNQYLIAIDTHSKFVFAYGKITGTQKIVGKDLPVKFDAVENYESRRKFYEYDPIGFVRYDQASNKLTLTLYEEYKGEMSQSAVKFFPQVHDSKRAVASDNQNSPGRSPYFQEINLENLTAFQKQVAAKNFGKREQTTYTYKTKNSDTGGQEKEFTKTGNGFVKHVWEFDSYGTTLTFRASNDMTGALEEKTYTYQGEEESGASATYKLADESETITLKVSGTSLQKADSANGAAQTVGDSAFVDAGADFILRVRGMTFQKEAGGKIVRYKFSEDGGYVVAQNMTGRTIGDSYSGSGVYYFVDEKPGDKTKGLYQWYGGSISILYTNPYYGLNLLDDGYKQIQRTRAKGDKDPWKEDSDILDTVTDYFSGESEIGDIVNAVAQKGDKTVKVTVTAKNMKNVNMVSKDIGFFSDGSRDTAYFIHIIRSSLYRTEETPLYNNLSWTFDKYEAYGGATAAGAGDTIKPNETRALNKKEEYPPLLVEDGKDIFVNLDTRIWLYGYRLGFVETATDPIKLSDLGAPVVTLKYDKNTDTLKFDKISSGTINGINTWSVKKGETKEIMLEVAKTTEKYYVQKASSNAQAKMQITYEIKLEVEEH